jgi:hypothetical protein
MTEDRGRGNIVGSESTMVINHVCMFKDDELPMPMMDDVCALGCLSIRRSFVVLRKVKVVPKTPDK